MGYLNKLIQAYGWHFTEAEILQSTSVTEDGADLINDIYVPGDWSHRPYIVFSDVMFNCDQSRHVQFADTGKTLKHVNLWWPSTDVGQLTSNGIGYRVYTDFLDIIRFVEML